ncbi:beta-ketoacyl synthase N-terminal-like domain-containing protein [Photobacterium sp. TY1-4]|uniref:beta-ketoacyl synthase N-terminal-like domain-containing protein n=1 Tax=Photobacterium sp. TY1-4 TaxID=2899122 RepID=UPI0021BF7DB5|nr:beta-ketoacyl synthase N-terminal-like domain-containing protein [Photobacterium sp. TY1-4]UXI00908.1 condensation domain-containing protein [Photobacterium sp. TY1-4]
MSENKELARYLLEQVQKGEFDKGHALALIKALGAGQSRAEVAIVGIACRFSAAENPDAFWHKLVREKTGGGTYSSQRHADMRYLFGEPAVPKDAGICINNLLSDVDRFDAGQFALLAKEAQLMDPGQRELLLSVWQAIDDAGFTPQQWMNTNTGVFVGMDDNGRFDLKRYVRHQSLYSSMGSMTGWFPGRVATTLNLEGPCLAIDTGCSSGLVALDTAVNAIRSKQCEQAVVSAVNLVNLYQSTAADGMEGMNATTPTSAAFDDHANGMLWGEGVCTLIIKPLRSAVAAGDHIYGVIRGTAVNHDGQAVRQGKVLQKAWQDGQIEPQLLDYIEAHGTGTHLGDSIELSSITNAFKPYTTQKQFCGLGSLMANIGHTAGVSGLARVIKVLLAMKYDRLPPSPNFNIPNHHMQLEQSPVYIQDRLTAWPNPGKKKLAGISAFSMNKTNCHVVIEEYVAPEKDRPAVPYVLTVSGDDPEQLKAQCNAMAARIRQDDTLVLGDVCFTANTGRQLRRHVLTLAFTSRAECLRQLAAAGVLLGSQIDSENTGAWPRGVLYHALDPVPMAARSLHLPSAADTIDPHPQSQPQLQLLAQVDAIYRAGQRVDWASLYQGHAFQRVSLPGYPRNTERCWPPHTVLIPSPAGGEAPREPEAEPQQAHVRLTGHQDDAYTATEQVIGDVWGELFALDTLAVDRSFVDYGGNSLSAAVMVQSLSHRLHKSVKADLLYRHQTITALAAAIDAVPVVDLQVLPAIQAVITGERPISSTQAFMLEVSQTLNNPGHLTVGAVLSVQYALEPQVVRDCVQYLDRYFDILRARFTHTEAGWRQEVLSPAETVNFHLVDLTGVAEDERKQVVEQTVNQSIYEFNLTSGPLYAVTLFTQGEGQPVYLAAYFHHVLMDAFSLNLYMGHLLSLSQQVAHGGPLSLGEKPLSYYQFIDESQRYAREIQAEQADFMTRTPLEQLPLLPRDIPDGINYRYAKDMVKQVFDRELTEKLCRQLVKQHQVTVIDILVAALAHTIARWTQHEWVEIHSVITGRDVILDRSHDFSKTLGLFAVGCDLVLRDRQSESPLAYLLDVQSQLQSLPAKGCGNFITQNIEQRQPGSRYEYLRKQVSINYLGDMFEVDEASPARVVDDIVIDIDDSHLVHADILDVRGSIQNGQLTMIWGFSRNIHDEATIRELSEHFRDFLNHLAECC